MSSMTRTFSSDVADPRFVGQNLAVASGNYANISLRLGYHFSMIDTIASPKNDENYVYFRFFGGVTDKTRRSRRAQFIQAILSTNDFMTKTKGDLIVGRIKGAGKNDILKKIFILGGLVSYTRQLDVKMRNDNSVIEFTKDFQRILADIGHTGST
jgi:pyruvate,water dikinase